MKERILEKKGENEGAFLQMTELCHVIVRERVCPGDVVVDATAGNGYDAEFLLSCVGPAGTLYAFDVQQKALRKTEKRLLTGKFTPLPDRIRLIHDSHGNMNRYVSETIRAAIFNLGYLPGSDHTCTTCWTEVEKALTFLLNQALAPGGIIGITSYSGHPKGKEEQGALQTFTTKLPVSQYRVLKCETLNALKTPPALFVIEKKKTHTNEVDVEVPS